MPICWSQWSGGLRRGSAAALLLGLWVRILPVAGISFYCECCVFSSRGLCFGSITCPEEPYRVWCFWVWSWCLVNKKALAHWGLSSHEEKYPLNRHTTIWTRVRSQPIQPDSIQNLLPNKLVVEFTNFRYLDAPDINLYRRLMSTIVDVPHR